MLVIPRCSGKISPVAVGIGFPDLNEEKEFLNPDNFPLTLRGDADCTGMITANVPALIYFRKTDLFMCKNFIFGG